MPFSHCWFKCSKYYIKKPHLLGNDITIDISKLQPGIYTMIVVFDGKYNTCGFREYVGISKPSTLTVLPKNAIQM